MTRFSSLENYRLLLLSLSIVIPSLLLTIPLTLRSTDEATNQNYKHFENLGTEITASIRSRKYEFSPADFNHTIWDTLLKRYVHTNQKLYGMTGLNLVDYKGIRQDALFDTYLALLSEWNTGNLTRSELMALYMNAYNAYAVKLVADNPCKVRLGKYCYPTKSIWDIGYINRRVWDFKVVNIGGNVVSLDETEAFVRNMGDPRIHACLVCASISCPNLRPGAFDARELVLHQQMDEEMEKFLANPTKGFRLDEEAETMYVSYIFKWYQQDFDDYMKMFNGTVKDFIIARVPKQYQEYLLTHQESLITNYLAYNWRLNQHVYAN